MRDLGKFISQQLPGTNIQTAYVQEIFDILLIIYTMFVHSVTIHSKKTKFPNIRVLVCKII